MKRLKLTDEEVRLIEQRRANEALHTRGWNDAIMAVETFIQEKNLVVGSVLMDKLDGMHK